MPYNLTYENLQYPDFSDSPIPDSQPLCEGLGIKDAFATVAELEARAFLEDGAFGYEATNLGYAVVPDFNLEG